MRTIEIEIVGRSAETDAPSVDDLLDQLRDYFDILKGVEQAVAEDGQEELDWRVIDASKNSPLNLKAAAFARVYATNVDRRADIVVRHTANGLRALQMAGAERPPFFTDAVLIKAEHLFSRVTKGLAETVINHGDDLPVMELDGAKAYAAVANVQQLLKPPPKAYKETGSVEGIAHGFDRDGYNNPVLKLRHRATGADITCRLSGQALAEIERRQVGELWRNSRVLLYGTIHFKAPGRILRVDAHEIRFLRKSDDLPSLDDVTDPDFAGGLSSEEYLERLRNGLS
jgi:hypothetical protein